MSRVLGVQVTTTLRVHRTQTLGECRRQFEAHLRIRSLKVDFSEVDNLVSPVKEFFDQKLLS
jgi:hypothetical protein